MTKQETITSNGRIKEKKNVNAFETTLLIHQNKKKVKIIKSTSYLRLNAQNVLNNFAHQNVRMKVVLICNDRICK